MQDKIKIIIAAHKADPNIRKEDIYMPIHVGKELNPDVELGFQGDNTGDNISNKNQAYCELTAVYWAWKNLKDVDIVGLAHYRRYFKDIKNDDDIRDALKEHDVVMLKSRSLPCSVADDLERLLSMEEVAIMVDTLLSEYPNLRQDVIDYFYRGNHVSQGNMMIMKWKDFDAYCNFLFPLLSKIEAKIPVNNYMRQKRNLGYMAEALLGLYVQSKGMKIKRCQKEEVGQPEQSRIKDSIKRIRDNFAFKLYQHPNKIYVYDSVRTGLKGDNIQLENI